jgi:uncharacterized protein
MNCSEVSRLLSALVDGELEPGAADAVSQHLLACARCRSGADSLRALRDAVIRACPAEPAPSRLRANLRAALGAQDPVRLASWTAWLVGTPGLAALLLVAWLLAAQPWNRPVPSMGGARVVYHVAGNDNIGAVLRTLRNHLDAAPEAKIVIVAHNSGIEFLLQGAADDSGRPYAAAVSEFRARGVEFRVCTNTLTRRQIDMRAVIPEAVLVPSGIEEISRLQAREGYTYLRL